MDLKSILDYAKIDMGVKGFDLEADYPWHAEVASTLFKPLAKQITGEEQLLQAD